MHVKALWIDSEILNKHGLIENNLRFFVDGGWELRVELIKTVFTDPASTGQSCL